MAKEPSLSYYLPIAWGENIGIYVFLKGFSTKWSVHSLIQD